MTKLQKVQVSFREILTECDIISFGDSYRFLASDLADDQIKIDFMNVFNNRNPVFLGRGIVDMDPNTNKVTVSDVRAFSYELVLEPKSFKKLLRNKQQT